MYLADNSVSKATRTQYIFKMKANFNYIFNIIIIQMFAILISMTGSAGKSSESYNNGSVQSISLVNSDFVLVMSLVAILIISIYITMNKQRNIDFTLVTNRLTSNLSNTMFLITLNIISAILVTLSIPFIRVLDYFIYGADRLGISGFQVSPLYLLSSFLVFFSLSLLFSSIGFFLGSLSKLAQNLFLKIIIAVFIMIILIIAKTSDFYNFYLFENSLLLFILKTLITTIIFFSIGIIITNRTEVNR